MNRVLSSARASEPPAARADAPRHIRNTLIDFSTLLLPSDVTLAFAEAFWSHIGAGPANSTLTAWGRLKTFSRFVRETGALCSLADMRLEFLSRYVEWLNAQCRADGRPWAKSSRAGPYLVVRTLLQWLERCRPGMLAPIEYPLNPFPWRNRDAQRVRKLTAQDLKAILKACELDIAQLRALRTRAEAERAMLRASGGDPDPLSTLGGLLEHVERHCGGIIPPASVLCLAGNHALRLGLAKFGGCSVVEPCLYPRLASLVPYYLTILLHTAGNAGPIAELSCDCLQPIPLLDDRQMLVWAKRRGGTVQRRSFRSTAAFEPPALVREVLEWTQKLRPHVAAAHRDRLFLYKGPRSVATLKATTVNRLLRSFSTRHHLSRFTLASIRPSVLTAVYQASGDLRQVKSVANHAHLSTTVRYVEGPAVEAQHRARIGALQVAFLGRGEPSPMNLQAEGRSSPSTAPQEDNALQGPATTVFGFTCKDPYSGVAPGSRQGELCPSFLGCFTCPNAIIAPDAATLARLLQARDHLRAAAARLHPARWEAIYAPQLRILEEDILGRFSARELARAERLQATLLPLPDLR